MKIYPLADLKEKIKLKFKDQEITIDYLPPFIIEAIFIPTYPSHTLPIFRLLGSFYQPQFEKLIEALKEIWMEGVPVLYSWYEFLKAEFLETNPPGLVK
jgi:hypothetical protein